jgi:hypothetical protein
MAVAAKHCPGALQEIEAAVGRQSRGYSRPRSI